MIAQNFFTGCFLTGRNNDCISEQRKFLAGSVMWKPGSSEELSFW